MRSVKYIVSLFVVVLAIAFSFSACSKNKQELLKGKWKLLKYPEVADAEQIWSFADGKVYIDNISKKDTLHLKHGNYAIKNNTLNFSGEGMWSAGVEYYKGDFTIRRLTNTEMILYRTDGGLAYYEFIKKE